MHSRIALIPVGLLFLLCAIAFAQTPSFEALGEPYISISPDQFYPLEEILYVEGRADPNAIVSVLIEKQGDKPIKFTVKADSAGEWVVAEKTFLSAGNPRVIRSVVTGIDFFGLQVRYAVLAAVAALFLAIITALFIYFRKKIQRLQRGLMEKQLRETEERFHKGFAEIRGELMDQLKALANETQGRALTPDEVGRRNRILAELEELERNLEHDIGDISKRY
jgi:hypothetical protein